MRPTAATVLLVRVLLSAGCAEPTTDVTPTAPVPSVASEGPPGCQFHVPEQWRGSVARWTGECRDTIAVGPGVLRMHRDGKSEATFYGEMAHGSLSLGVIDTGDGYLAGRFKAGILEGTDDRNVIIRAFRTASHAARAASERSRAAGDMASAQYYATMAHRLADQLD